MVNPIGISKVNHLGQEVKETKPKVNPKASFYEVLQEQLSNQELKFSAHAINRLQQRSVDLDNQIMNRLENAVKQAAAKGSRQSLVMVDDLVFVVSVANKTVITAMSGESRKENVFTNVDSVVIA